MDTKCENMTKQERLEAAWDEFVQLDEYNMSATIWSLSDHYGLTYQEARKIVVYNIDPHTYRK